MISEEEDLAMDQGPGLITQELLCSRVLLKYKKGAEKASDIDIRRRMESAPLVSLSKGAIYFFNWLL